MIVWMQRQVAQTQKISIFLQVPSNKKHFLPFLNVIHIFIPDLFHGRLHLHVAADSDLEGPPDSNILGSSILHACTYFCACAFMCLVIQETETKYPWKCKLIQYSFVNRNVCPANWNCSQQLWKSLFLCKYSRITQFYSLFLTEVK
jgi:hypothetical protein